MLVLARRPGQKVVFPGLGITVEVLRSKGVVTRLGIEAPDEVEILREEILDKPAAESASPTCLTVSPMERSRRHELRDRLNQVTLKLQLLQRQLELGQASSPEESLAGVFSELSHLEQSTEDTAVSENAPRVLIVEDHDNERELLADCLRLAGVRVTTARNGREAFDVLHDQELPDLVLLDMRMPDIDGPTLLKSIRDDIRLHDLRVFAVSGSDRNEFGSSLPVDGWFSKPVRVDSLLRAVRSERTPSKVLA